MPLNLERAVLFRASRISGRPFCKDAYACHLIVIAPLHSALGTRGHSRRSGPRLPDGAEVWVVVRDASADLVETALAALQEAVGASVARVGRVIVRGPKDVWRLVELKAVATL